MTTEVSITEKTEADWIVAHDAGKWLVGRPTDDMTTTVLSPVLELHCQTIPLDANGRVCPPNQQPAGVKINYVAQPLLLITSIDTWRLSPEAQSWPVKGASVEAALRSAIAQGEEQRDHMRAQQAGLTLARTMPKMRLNGLG